MTDSDDSWGRPSGPAWVQRLAAGPEAGCPFCDDELVPNGPSDGELVQDWLWQLFAEHAPLHRLGTSPAPEGWVCSGCSRGFVSPGVFAW